MQLIEVSEIGVRAAIIKMTSPKSRLAWLLFPMVHLGAPSYYAEVEKKMHSCNLVLAEGVDSAIVRALTGSYRNAADGTQTVVQPPIPRRPAGPEVIHADVSGEAFDDAWGRLPLAMRLGVPLIAPLYGFWLRYFADPEEFRLVMQEDDLPSRDHWEAEELMPELFDVILHGRDAHLLHQVDLVQERWGSEQKTAGVVWGAGHIGKVAHHLADRHGYIARGADWVSVFSNT